jgi:NAD(P)-dependent dehydrogenase (short-subunit alcohol dehydrogenase family)
VSFFGHVAIIQALLPALLSGRGRVVYISSIGGRVAFASYGAYAASKFALETVSDVLHREVGRYGVKMLVVEPGTVATPMWGKGLDMIPRLAAGMSHAQQARYGDPLAAMTKQAETNVRSGKRRRAGRRGASDRRCHRCPQTASPLPRRPRRHAPARVAGLLPDRALDRLIARNLGLYKPNATIAAAQVPTQEVDLAAR